MIRFVVEKSKGWVLVTLMLLLLQPAANTAPLDFYRVTRDQSLIQALGCLEQSSARPSVEFILTQGVKILFKDMKQIGKAYRDHDALTIITDSDQQIIFINAKHATAPPPALAALISHEVLHSDRNNSIHEEIVAWSRESRTWEEMRTRYPELAKIPTGKVPLIDRLNAVMVLEQQNKLKDEILTNVAYQGLPERSPGF